MLEIKRPKDDPEKLEMFFKSNLPRLLKMEIIYPGSVPDGEYSPESHHQSILRRAVQNSALSSLSQNSLIRSYKRSFNGFAAELTEHERQSIANMEEVVSIFPNVMFHPETTRSWDFMGLPEKAVRSPSVESDLIVGVIDSGIWPESDSFKDEGFGPPPKKWKGVCKGGKNFTCNNKIIGARYYEEFSARDTEGHGTHTASTAAGNAVRGASYEGIAEGVARGGVPSSRIAVYKVCAPDGCGSAGILAAFDDAIADGVDIITVSLGGIFKLNLDRDPISIGSFHAMKSGILTVNSAGNSGPMFFTSTSLAPWLFSVAASTTDRRIVDKVVLGNGKTLMGDTVNAFALNGTTRPLVHGVNASKSCVEIYAGGCDSMCLDEKLVRGKIVLCDKFDHSMNSYNSGAAGVIMNAKANSNLFFVSPFPTSALIPEDYAAVLSYAKTDGNPRANILKSEEVKDKLTPKTVWFSSRGPNSKLPDIMKPDISAPGRDILAAYSPLASPSKREGDKRSLKYSIMSGTSMSCPHAAGAAAYVKSFHPDWSPSAIKSSIMTTAWMMNDTYHAEFEHGSGHINPAKATDPGLVYEIFEKDYINLLCSLNFTQGSLAKISGDNSTKCDSAASVKGSQRDLNYPSMTAQVESKRPDVVKFRRRVKNVGPAKSVYKAQVLENFNNDNVTVSVTPNILSFERLNEEKGFEVNVTRKGHADGMVFSGSLVWSDGTRTVRSPIVLYTSTLS